MSLFSPLKRIFPERRLPRLFAILSALVVGWIPLERQAPGIIVISGELSLIELDELKSAVGLLTDEPIRWIEFERPDLIEIFTGRTCGPLCGGGMIFEFRKENGAWVQTNAEVSMSWGS
jgi:hypothetical protein